MQNYDQLINKNLKGNPRVTTQTTNGIKKIEDAHPVKPSLPSLSSNLLARFQILEKLGSGSFGQIYRAYDSQRSEIVALKIENHPISVNNASINSLTLGREAKILTEIGGVPGLPTVHFFIKEESYSVLELGLLGPNLEKLCKACNRKFSLKTVLMLGEQMLKRIEYSHSRGYLHRDIKPENFVMGHPSIDPKTLYLIDFGLSKAYREASTGKHISYKENKGLVGTARYASISTHLGIEQSRRDDLESIGYLLIYLLKGGLPWQTIRANNKTEKYKLIADCKMNVPIEELCKGTPREFISYMHHVRNLTFTDAPDYKYLRRLFRKLMIENNWNFDFDYDWQTSQSKKSNHQHLKTDLGHAKKNYNNLSHEKKPEMDDEIKQNPFEFNTEFRKSAIKLQMASSNLYSKQTKTSKPEDSTHNNALNKHLDYKEHGAFLIRQQSMIGNMNPRFATNANGGVNIGVDSTKKFNTNKPAFKHSNTIDISSVGPRMNWNAPLSSFNHKENDSVRAAKRIIKTAASPKNKVIETARIKNGLCLPLLDTNCIAYDSCGSLMTPVCKSSRNMMPEKPIFTVCNIADGEIDEPESPVASYKEHIVSYKRKKTHNISDKKINNFAEFKNVKTVLAVQQEEHDFIEEDMHERISIETNSHQYPKVLSIKRLEELKVRKISKDPESILKENVMVSTGSMRDCRDNILFRHSMISTGTGVHKVSIYADT